MGNDKVHAGTYTDRDSYERFKLAGRVRGCNPSRALREAMDLYVEAVASEDGDDVLHAALAKQRDARGELIDRLRKYPRADDSP